MSDWKERMERIKAANEGTYKKAGKPKKPNVSEKSHPSRHVWEESSEKSHPSDRFYNETMFSM